MARYGIGDFIIVDDNHIVDIIMERMMFTDI